MMQAPFTAGAANNSRCNLLEVDLLNGIMKQFLLLGGVTALLSGCVTTLAPHTPYLPVLQERGQAEARLATGAGGSELQVGYQATDKLVIHAGLLKSGRAKAANDFRSADLGLGYYYLSPNGYWRLGMHAGGAYGAGSSGDGSCFECAERISTSKFSVRYTYGYLQPTVLLVNAKTTWGFGFRVGHAYYQQLDERRTDTTTGLSQLYEAAGHRSTFVQPMFQFSYRANSWLRLSTKFGIQRYLGAPSLRNEMNPLVAQAGVHFVLNKRAALRR